MYQFHDYFDDMLRDQPYTTPGEELEDYLRLLDMMLENYIEYKGTGSSKKKAEQAEKMQKSIVTIVAVVMGLIIAGLVAWIIIYSTSFSIKETKPVIYKFLCDQSCS